MSVSKYKDPITDQWIAIGGGSGGGADGVGIADIRLKSEAATGNTYTIVLTDGNSYDFVSPAGPAGKDGTNGTNGTNGKDGANGKDGTDGAGVKSMTYNVAANNWTVTLTDNTTLTVDGPAIPDVSGYMPKSGGTFTGAVKAAAAATGGYYVRNIKFSETAETPTTEGDICFKLA